MKTLLLPLVSVLALICTSLNSVAQQNPNDRIRFSAPEKEWKFTEEFLEDGRGWFYSFGSTSPSKDGNIMNQDNFAIVDSKLASVDKIAAQLKTMAGFSLKSADSIKRGMRIENTQKFNFKSFKGEALIMSGNDKSIVLVRFAFGNGNSLWEGAYSGSRDGWLKAKEIIEGGSR